VLRAIAVFGRLGRGHSRGDGAAVSAQRPYLPLGTLATLSSSASAAECSRDSLAGRCGPSAGRLRRTVGRGGYGPKGSRSAAAAGLASLGCSLAARDRLSRRSDLALDGREDRYTGCCGSAVAATMSASAITHFAAFSMMRVRRFAAAGPVSAGGRQLTNRDPHLRSGRSRAMTDSGASGKTRGPLRSIGW